MFSRLYTSNPLIARSNQQKSQTVLDFSTLSESEKRQYLRLLHKNKIDMEKDPNDSLYIAHIKIVKQQHLEQEIQDSRRSYTPDLTQDTSFSRPVSRQEMNGNNSRPKSEKRDRSLQATNRSGERESSREKPKFTSITQEDTNRSLTKGRNMKSTGQLLSRDRIEQFKSNRNDSPILSTRRLVDDRGRCLESPNTDNSRLERRFAQRSRSPISDCTKECYNHYSEFYQLANMSNCVAYLRPKKIPLESLNKIVEEIFSLQFVHGTSMVKAVVNKKQKHGGVSPINHFAVFVLDYLKERTQNQPRAVEQNVLNLAYSVYWFRKKSSEIELFSKFLAGEADDDDLTFFLFLRFSTEKEINVSLPNYPASPSNLTMSVRSCYRILEIIYGKYQKELLNELTQKIKEFIVEERERRQDFAVDGIPIYSFLYITFEDYLFNKQKCRDNIEFEPEDIINETTEEKEESHRDLIYYSMGPEKPYLQPADPNREYFTRYQPAIEKRSKDPMAVPLRNNKVCFTEPGENRRTLQSSASSKTYKQYGKEVSLPVSKNLEKPSSLNILAPRPSQDDSPDFKKRAGSSEVQSFSSVTSTGALDFLQELCINLMLEKINEFIDVALFERKNVKEIHKEFIKIKLLEIFKRKFINIIKALFSFDKMKWLDALLIEEPTLAQLQNVEVLQKELRELKKLSLDTLNRQNIMLFTNRILRTPELSIQIGRLILEFDCEESAGIKEKP